MTWANQLKISNEIDCFVNQLIDDDSLVHIPKQYRHTAEFKTKSGKVVSLWISNYPYAYGSVYARDGKKFTIESFGPSFQTRKRLKMYIEAKRRKAVDSELESLMLEDPEESIWEAFK